MTKQNNNDFDDVLMSEIKRTSGRDIDLSKMTASERQEIIATAINRIRGPRRQVPNANDERRNAITQIRFQQSVKDLAMNKAHSMGISLAEYLRILILKDNGEM